jgi:hypothetical protein
MLYSGASIWECIPIYWDAHIYMGMHSHILGDPVSGNAFQDTGVPQGPRVNWNAFSYIGIPQYLGMHSHTPGTPVYGNALPYSRASQYMRMHSHIRGYPLDEVFSQDGYGKECNLDPYHGKECHTEKPTESEFPHPGAPPPPTSLLPRGHLNCLNISRHYHGMICQLAIQFKMWYSCIHTTPSCECYATVVFFLCELRGTSRGPSRAMPAQGKQQQMFKNNNKNSGHVR